MFLLSVSLEHSLDVESRHLPSRAQRDSVGTDIDETALESASVCPVWYLVAVEWQWLFIQTPSHRVLATVIKSKPMLLPNTFLPEILSGTVVDGELRTYAAPELMLERKEAAAVRTKDTRGCKTLTGLASYLLTYCHQGK